MDGFFDGASTIGASRATGLPRLVINTVSPVAWTSSIRARHLALNSPAGIVRMGRLPSRSIIMTMVILSWSWRFYQNPDHSIVTMEDVMELVQISPANKAP